MRKSLRVSSNRITGSDTWMWYYRFLNDPLQCLTKMRDEFGAAVALGNPIPWGRKNRQRVCVLDAEGNREVLGDPVLFRQGSVAPPGPPGSALNRIRSGFNLPRSVHQESLRKLILPAFQRGAISGHQDVVIQASEQIMGRWRHEEVVPMWSRMRDLSLIISCRLLFGRESLERATHLGGLLQEFSQQSFLSSASMLPLNLPGTPYRAFLKLSERVAAELQTMLQERLTPCDRGTDLLETLVRGMSDQFGPESVCNLLGPALFMFFASYETTAGVLTWTLFLMAQHPEIMRDLYSELDGVLHGAPPTLNQLDRFPLLDGVVKESMRILPPIPMLHRIVTQETSFRDLVLCRGDRVICSQYLTHHSPEIYSHPQRFDPYRWFSIQPAQYEYFPFGVGPRSCVGYFLGMTTIKVCLAMILQNWRLTVLEQSRVDRSVKAMLSPRPEIFISVHKQDRRFQSSTIHGNIHDMVEFPSSQTIRLFQPGPDDADVSPVRRRPEMRRAEPRHHPLRKAS